MARPKNNPIEDYSATERESAPATAYAPAPQQVHVERRGSTNAPIAGVLPDIRGGTCEKCGTLDPNVPSQYQYKLCPHYRGLEARCSYCPDSKDPNDVVYHSNLKVWEYPIGSGNLVMLCNSFSCAQAHEKRFKSSL